MFGVECGDIDPSNECCGDAGAFGDEGGDIDSSNECFGDVIAFGDEGAGDTDLSGAGSNSPDPFEMGATSSAGPISKSGTSGKLSLLVSCVLCTTTGAARTRLRMERMRYI